MLAVPFSSMNLFSNSPSSEAMAIENGNVVNRFIESVMDIANSDIDEYDSPESDIQIVMMEEITTTMAK